MKINRSGECKNSPKNAFVENLVIDLFTATSLEGRVEGIAWIPLVPHGVSEVEMVHAISHGKIGAANGSLTVGGAKQPFAVFIEFTSTKATLARSVSLYLKGSS